MRLAIFGATGRTGRDAVRQAVSRGHEVRALARDWSGRTGAMPSVAYREADILGDDLSVALGGTDAVISAVGVGLSPRALLDPPPLHTEGTRAILAGMRAAGVPRLIVVSACFVAGRDRGPPLFRAASVGLDPVFTQMGEMEHILRRTEGVDWTAVRPAWLLNAPLTATYRVTSDTPPDGLYRTRTADLAHFMLDCAEHGTWSRRTPAIAREEAGRPERAPVARTMRNR